MKTGDRIQNTAYRGPQGRPIDSKRKGVTMAEVDAYYEGLLREIKEMEELLQEDNDGQKRSQENNEKG